MFYKDIPTDTREQLIWRKGVLRAANTDEAIREELWIACKREILFYVNTFVWTFDPRTEGVIPFNTYEFQDDALIEMAECFGKEDMFIEKSRDMGASWLNLILIDHKWKFTPDMDILLVSRNESYVDLKGNQKALFSKLDLLNKWQPSWLVPHHERSKLMLKNLDNGSMITGESTTGDVGRGDRKTAILLDEFAAVDVKEGYKALNSTRDVTKCRIFNSTYQGVNNAFYETGQRPKIKKFRFHWSQHPEKAKGLYQSEKGVLRILDETYRFESTYEFILDDKLRSPWYDVEESRTVNKMEMAQEVDINPIGGDYQFFDLAILDKVKAQHCRPPYRVCNFSYNDMACDPIGFDDDEKGFYRLWTVLKGEAPDPEGLYFVGCDVATGTGATNSVMSVGNSVTGEKVVEYANPNILPYEFAKMAVSMSRFFVGRDGAGARLIWEANGPGREFGQAVLDSQYGNIYYRENMDTRKSSNFPGWWSGPKEKQILLSEYRRALSKGEFINRSLRAIGECTEYIQGVDTVEHMGAKNSFDPSSARDNHGDRVIADAVLWWAMKTESRYTEPEQDQLEAPEGSLQWRMDNWERQKTQKEGYLY